MPLATPSKTLEHRLVESINEQFQKIINEEIEVAKKRVEERMRTAAARTALTIHKYFVIQYLKDTIVIKIDSRDLNL